MAPPRSYRDAGVDLGAADAALNGIRDAVASTYTPRVIRGLGAFGGLFRAADLPERPVLVATTDGVGRDLVNHCVDDVLAQGATPLFFLDYVASSRLEPAVVAELVGGMAVACREAGAALLGGETAEMPGVYAPGEVGVVSEDRLLDGSRIRDGDLLLGLASGGLQTNGFSLARSVLADRLEMEMPDGRSAGEHLLDAHRSFLPAVAPLLEAGVVRGAAHVTGGGLQGNLPRVLPGGLGAEIDGSWPEPAIFGTIRRLGSVDEAEMRTVFNLGVGFVLAIAPGDVARAEALCPEPLLRVGRVVRGDGVQWT